MNKEKENIIKEIFKQAIPLLNSQPEGEFIPSSQKAPEGFSMEKHVVGNVPVEELIPDEIKVNHVVLHLHGGGYVAGINDVYRDIATQYSQVAGGARVFSIDYRLGPTNKFPSALDDAVLVYKWLIEQGHSEIVIVGDSAGGNLTLATTLYLKDHEIPLPKAVIGISAWTALGHELPSIKFNNSRDALLGKDGAEAKREIEHSSYFEDTDINSPYTSPMLGDYKGFPPFLLQVGSYERFYDEILITAQNAKTAGVDVKLSLYEGMFHVFQLLIPNIDETVAAWNEMKEFIAEHTK